MLAVGTQGRLAEVVRSLDVCTEGLAILVVASVLSPSTLNFGRKQNQ